MVSDHIFFSFNMVNKYKAKRNYFAALWTSRKHMIKSREIIQIINLNGLVGKT